MATQAAAADSNRPGAADKPSRHLYQPSKARPGVPSSRVKRARLDATLEKLASNGSRDQEAVDVIAMQLPNTDLPTRFKRYARRGRFEIIGGYALDRVPVRMLRQLAGHASTHRVTLNRAAYKHDSLSSAAVIANARDAGHAIDDQFYGYTGSGVTVAVIDSGFTSYEHPDVADSRVSYLNFINSDQTRRDDDGHGTHVTGIVGGTGTADPRYAGIAPGTSIVSMKVLDANGRGSIADVIAAMEWIYKNPQANIRVVNMSVGARVTESYWMDPLALAAKALVDRGIIVVAAAGNRGMNAGGELQWGGITSPGIAPWVLTVCAFTTSGTYDRIDDAVANFSSSGPTAFDFSAKPDICAPGVGIVSAAAPESTLYSMGAQASPTWLAGADAENPYAVALYESLSGTSAAAPFVTGAVALMLEANPTLTPNLVKGLLQYTATFTPGLSPLRQGAGFMNVAGALSLAAAYYSQSGEVSQPPSVNADPNGVVVPPADDRHVVARSRLTMPATWSKRLLWGNHMLTGGVIDPNGSAWRIGVAWGSAQTQATAGDNIVWGTVCAGECDNIVWGTAADGENIVWGTAAQGDNIVWGTAAPGDNIVWGTALDGDNIVWGTATDEDNIVWGTDCGGADCDQVIWGAVSLEDNIVWGTAAPGDNIVWGTAAPGDNIVWGTATDDDNIVWGTATDDDNIVWGTAIIDEDNIVWGTASRGDAIWPVYRTVGN